MANTKSKRLIATFFLLIFFPTILPVNLVYASNNGPGASDAATFEPVDAPDMVNLVTGDLSYVLPLLNVPSPEGGYPLALSYHAGIAMDQEASWVGLGWSLNPGAINRSAYGYADDIDKGEERVTMFDDGGELNYYSVGIGANYRGISIGVGANWGSNKTFGGTVSLGALMTDLQIGKDNVVNPNAVNKYTGFTLGTGSGNGVSRGGLSRTYSSFNQGKYDLDVSFKGFNINSGINFYYGHKRLRYRLFSEDNKDFSGSLYPLFSDEDYYTHLKKKSDVNRMLMYNQSTSMVHLLDENKHYLYKNQLLPEVDRYSVSAQGLNGSITPAFLEEIPLFYKDINKYIPQNYNSPLDPPGTSYTGYNYRYDYSTNSSDVFSNLNNSLALNNKFFFEFENSNSSFLRVDRSNITCDGIAGTTIPDNHYYTARTNNSGVYSENTLVNATYPNGVALKSGNRKRTGKFIETFTNADILSGTAYTGGWFIEAKNLSRNQPGTYAAKSIGGFRITDVDGKVYHYSLPVINYETWYKNFTEEDDEDDKFVEIEQSKPYATDWLLTAVTGPDYIDTNNNGQLDSADSGYWVEFDYGKWSDGYIWNSSSGDHDVVKEGRDRYDSYEYYKGRKQIYYLDAVRTRTHTAYFVKSLRNDAQGQSLVARNTVYNGSSFNPATNCKIISDVTKDWGSLLSDYTPSVADNYKPLDREKYNLPMNYGGEDAFHGKKQFLKYYDFPKHYLLKLDKIILVKNSSLSISKSAGTPLRSDQKAYLYENNGFYLEWIFDQSAQDYHNGQSGLYFTEPNKTISEINIHSSNNVIDVNDIQGLDVNSDAEKIIEFTHDNTLMLNSPNVAANVVPNGRLSLKKVNFLGHGGVQYVPGYTFEYNSGSYDENNEDGWGYNVYADQAKNCSLKKIITPTGSNINFELESDDYSAIAAKVSRLFNRGLRFYITRDTSTNEIIFKVYKNTETGDVITDTFEDIKKHFTLGQKISLDMFLCRKSKYGGLSPETREVKLDLPGVIGQITSVQSDYVEIRLQDNSNYWSLNSQDQSWVTNRYFSYTSVKHTNGNNDGVIMREKQSRDCWPWRQSYDNDDVVFQYKLASSNIPNVGQGGGVRVKSVSITNPVTNTTDIKYNYYYNKPGYDNNPASSEYISSGVTSFAPSKEVLIIPYASEIPPPVVMYHNVSVQQVDQNDVPLQKTDYVFETLNQFQEQTTNYSLGDYLSINELQNDSFTTQSGLATKFNTHQIKSKIGNLGRVLSIKNYNSRDQLLASITNNYFISQDAQGEIGVKQESFISKYLQWGIELPSISMMNAISRVSYPSVLVNSVSSSGGLTNTVYYDKFDFLTGQPLETRSVLSDGTSVKTNTVPAYTKYSGMQAKVDNMNNMNMLSQSAADYSYLFDSGSNSWKESGVGITTWNNNWTYKNIDGSSTTPTLAKQKIYRKHRTYIWKGTRSSVGVFQNYNSSNDDSFDWTIGASSQLPQWVQVSEIYAYDNYSNPTEIKDINNNPSCVKMGDNNTKIIAAGNGGYGEIFCSSAEYQQGSYLDAGVRLSKGNRVSTAHTGKYGVAATSLTQFGVLLRNEEHRAGRYKVSVWVHSSNAMGVNLIRRIGTNSISYLLTTTAIAGDWILKTAYVDVTTAETDLYFTSTSGTVIYDDLRIQPVNTAVTSYVYNDHDEISSIIGVNNLATRYEYDQMGRLIKTYVEIINDTDNNVIGGFKLKSKNDYHNHINQF